MQTESNRIEYKATLTDKLEREIVAFLNYHEGGVVYIGIEDNGNIIGIPDTDAIQLKIVNRIKDNILPNVLGLFDVILEQHDNKNVIKIVISSGTEKPYYIKQQGMSPSGCYLRVGSSAQPMSTDMIDNLYSMRLRQPKLSDTPSPRRDLSFEQLKIYYQEKGRPLNDGFAKTLDLLTPDGNYNYVAYLLADENSVSIKVAKYAGKDKVDLIENEEYGYCSLIKAAKRVLDKLTIENKTFTKITSSIRKEKRMVDDIALREAVINAIVHNDFSREVPPVFEIYSDRITITSYGGLVDGYSREDLLACISVPRNRELMRVFRDVDMVEQLGSGMSRILKTYDESVFKFTPNFMMVSLPFSQGFILPDGSADGSIDGSISSKDNLTAILFEIEKNPTIKIVEIATATSLSERTVARLIKELKNSGKLQRVGSTKFGHWEIIDGGEQL